MADEIKKVIEVDVSGALDSLDDLREDVVSAGYSFKSLGDAKKYIDTLKASLIDLDETSDEYVERVEEIDKVQDKLNKAMKATGSSLKAAEGSYNALSKQMSELKKKFKETNDEAERKVLAKQIVEINDQLKEMDSSIGNFQRNVGNYEAAFTKGIAGISKEIEALGNPLAVAKTGVIALGNAFKTLIANPVGAAIMAIVVAVKALKKGFEGNEEATNRLKRAFSSFQPVMNAINNIFTGFANLVGKIAEKVVPALVNALQKAGEWMMKLLNKIGIVSDEKLAAYQKNIEAQKEAIKVTEDLTNREIDLVNRRRQYQVQEAKGEMQIAELRAKASDKERYTAEERQKFLEDAISKERSLNASKLALAQEEYNILKGRAALTANTAADNDALAAAEANLYNVKREYYEKERGLIKELQATGKELTDAEKKMLAGDAEAYAAAEKLKEEELKKIAEIQERAGLSLLEAKERELKILENQYKEEYALLEKYGEDTLQLTAEYEKKREEIIAQNGGDKVKEIQLRAEQSLMDSIDRELDILKKKYDEEKKLLEAFGEDTVNLTKEYNNRVAELYEERGESKIKELNETAVFEQYIADKSILIELDKKEKILKIERERLLGTKKIYEDLLKLDDLSVQKKKEYERKLEEINADIADNSYQLNEVQKAQAMDLVNTYSQVVEGIGNLMSNIADLWEESIRQRVKNGKITEEEGRKEFENTKKMQIASAIVNGLAGVATAVSTAMTLGPIAGPIMAAINSALVITTTALQVAKIKQTTFDGGGSIGSEVASASATPSIPAMEYTPNYATNVTGESETVNLANAVSDRQQDQRVYVVESDINEAGRRVQVRESESTF